jgi:hypothetical protein
MAQHHPSYFYVCLVFFPFGSVGYTRRPETFYYHPSPTTVSGFHFFSGHDVNECNLFSCSGFCFFVIRVFLYGSKGSCHCLRVVFFLGSEGWVGAIKIMSFSAWLGVLLFSLFRHSCRIFLCNHVPSYTVVEVGFCIISCSSYSPVLQ